MKKYSSPGFFLFLFLYSITSCVVDEPDLSKYKGSAIQNLEEASHIDVIYTDSSYKLFNLKAPRMTRSYTRYSTLEVFPDGIDVTFFDRTGVARSWLKADKARRDQVNRRIIAEQNVVLWNDEGERINAPELIWDEKTKEISTDRFVKITQSDGTVVYSYGFKTNETFTRYELNAVSGDMYYREKQKASDQ